MSASIPYSEAPANTQTAVKKTGRNMALDRARTFLTVVVLVHHAVIAYTYFGHTDPKSWIGFDAIVLATDSFFMAMFFFLSGLFVWPGLARKGPLIFFKDRLLRLGLPFGIAILTIMPLGYYAIELRQQPDMHFSAFWWKTVTVGPWESGPVWFVWVLFAFDVVAILLYRLSPKLVDPINRLSLRSYARPDIFFLFLLAVTAMFYIPGRVYWGPSHWYEWGPFSVQARVMLYFSYFFSGASVGAANFDRGLLSPDGRLAKSNWGWAAVTLIPYCLMWALIYVKRGIWGNPPDLPDWYEALYGLFFVAFSAAIMFAILAYFLRFKQSGTSILDSMQADAFGIFLVHYPIVLWLQYWLFDFDLPAIVKAVIVFFLTLVLSWAATAALRKIPGASHVL
jgi:surface polysaccharide O-acyltransferase-like enzyme